jgi:ABC-type lipoprotein export system ATPase subunit
MLLSVENVSLFFGKRKILDNVSLKISEGEIVAITGKSGSGKTSLLGIMSGLLDPDGGVVYYKGENIIKWWDFKKSRYRNKEIGFVFQFFNLLPDLSAYENIVYPSLVKFFPTDLKGEVRELSKILGIEHILYQKPETLSGGERQRVAIARAIINRPKILLADEPTGNLDTGTALEIKNLFLRLRDEFNMSLIIVTHDEPLIEIADRHYHLEDGILTEKIIKRPQRENKTKRTASVKKTKSLDKKAQAKAGSKSSASRKTADKKIK